MKNDQRAQNPLGNTNEVTTDDDATIGENNAPLTMIVFTDFECPFCKRFFEDTYPKIRKDYIDSGKVKMVVRDLPLDFHQNAHKEAQAAECIREQEGDDAYFAYHDELFKRTTSTGTGITIEQLPQIADELGYDGKELQVCLDAETYKSEVDNDIAAATALGVTATPSFFIGKSDDSGTISGTMIVGAQPFAVFQTIIDEQL